jgi:predicted RNA methylase
LHADEVVLVVRAGRGVRRVVDAAAGRVVDLGGGVGAFSVVADELSDGVFAVAAVIGVVRVEAGRVVRELASGARDGDS